MKASTILSLLSILCFLPATALSQNECAGFLEQEHFHPEMKALNQKIQKEVINYRKKQTQVASLPEGSTERTTAESELKEMQKDLNQRKAQFKVLNHPNFPRTSLTAYGEACRDKRWVETAKQRLIQNPKNLGGTYHVWKDATTREVKVSRSRPEPAAIL